MRLVGDICKLEVLVVKAGVVADKLAADFDLFPKGGHIDLMQLSSLAESSNRPRTFTDRPDDPS